MATFEDINSRFFYHRLDVRIAATKDTHFDAWLGVIIRNNLLYAAEQVQVAEKDMTLFGLVNTFPLKTSHPLYHELEGGFPKGYSIALWSHNDVENPCRRIHQGDVISFSLMLVGDMATYYPYFVRAIDLMCQKGMGKPPHPFLLVDICETSSSGQTHLLAAGASVVGNGLKHSITMADFSLDQHIPETTKLRIRFETPVCLYIAGKKKDTEISFQDKCNRFPGFYQLVRSASYRLAKLYILYCAPDDETTSRQIYESLEALVLQATQPVLVACDIQWITLRSIHQKERKGMITLAGYVGEQVYEGKVNEYIPLLGIMQELGVGYEVVYGLGKYKLV